MKTKLLILMALLMQGCVTTKQPPLYGPWGESHQEQLRRTYSEAWCDGFLAGYEAKKGRAQIGIGGKIEYLGFFDDKADARAAYLEAKKKHHRIEL